jgi:predicted HTH domain antitoxin
MSQTVNATLLERELAATVRAGLFQSEAEALQEALGTFFSVKPQYRVEAALEMWKAGEISLERAAEIAGMNSYRFRDLMRQRGLTVVVEVDEQDVRQQSQELCERYL